MGVGEASEKGMPTFQTDDLGELGERQQIKESVIKIQCLHASGKGRLKYRKTVEVMVGQVDYVSVNTLFILALLRMLF